MSIFSLKKETKIVLVFVISICILGFSIAYFYYNSINKSEDPRVLQTKFMFMRFDALLKDKAYEKSLLLLDSIKQVFIKVTGYSESYELGMVYNNRASVYLSMALYTNIDSSEAIVNRFSKNRVKVINDDTVVQKKQKSLFAEKNHYLLLARYNSDTSIAIYQKWIDEYGKLTKENILEKVSPYFPESDMSFDGKNYKKILNKRLNDLLLAQKETPRRLSVAYTNLGIVQRHLYRQNEALESYIKAIGLWKENFTARNNLNVLYGRAPEDRSIIDKLFPPDKNK